MVTALLSLIEGPLVYVLVIGSGLAFLAISITFAKRVQRFATEKRNDPASEGWEKFNDHFRQLFLNLFLVSLATFSALEVFDLQRHQQRIFANDDLVERGMMTIDDLLNQQQEALQYLFMINLRVPTGGQDETSTDIFVSMLAEASINKQKGIEIANFERAFALKDLKDNDRVLYGRIANADLESFSALSYSIHSLSEAISVKLGDVKNGLYTIDPSERPAVQKRFDQLRSLAAEYIVSLCALYDRIQTAKDQTDHGRDFVLVPTATMSFPDELDSNPGSIEPYLKAQEARLRAMSYKDGDCYTKSASILRSGDTNIPFLRK